MAMYKATARGYDGVQIREVGEEFEFTDKPGSWMKLIGGDEAEAEAPAEKSNKKKKSSAHTDEE